MVIILGIESSCDETGVAIYHQKKGLLLDKVYSQTALHAEYGGVVPELASRDHIRKLSPLILQTLDETGIALSELSAIAYTTGPGLMGALMVGSSIAQALAWRLGIPALGIHHMEGHLMAAFLADSTLTYPFVALLISGGHTLLVDVKAWRSYYILGESLDDAVGEAFDKTAKLLGLAYPGGPLLAAKAMQGRAGVFTFPRPMVNRPGLDFSFSGLKTAVRTAWYSSSQSEQDLADIAYAFQQAVIDTLLIKCKRALQYTKYERLVLAGGVSANKKLRADLISWAKIQQVKVYYPEQALCTDNGAMIAYAGYLQYQQQQRQSSPFVIKPRWSLEDLSDVPFRD